MWQYNPRSWTSWRPSGGWKSFCYLGDAFDGYGGVDLTVTGRIRNGLMKFRECLPCLTSRALLSSPSCHQTVVFHLSTEDFAVSLNFERSSKVQGRARRVHFSTYAVFSVARPLCFHRNIYISSAAPCCLCNLYVVCWDTLHVVNGMACPLARLSSRLTELWWGVLFVLLSHSLHLMTIGG